MTASIRPRRGPAATIPVLEDGELAITTDTHRAFVGTGSGNVDVTAAYTLLGDSTPVPLSESGSGVAGTSALAARADHRHPLIVNADVSATAAIVLSKLGQSAASTNDVPIWNGTAWVPGAASSSLAQYLIGAYNYETDNTTSHYRIGVGFSTDGRSFSRTTEPAVTIGAGWKSDHVKDPFIVNVSGILWMYYSGSDGTNYKIGLARSFDGGTTWTDYASNPVLSANGSGWENAQGGVIFPRVLYDTTETDSTKRWKMFYSVSASGSTNGIGYAYSSDGLSWTKYAGNPILSPVAATWESTHVIPFAVVKRNGLFYLFYGAWEGTTFQGGLATFSDPTGTVTRSSSNPLLVSDGLTTTLTASISVGDLTITVADATIVPIGCPVWVGDASHHYLSHVQKRPSSTTLTLTDAAPLTVGTSGSYVRSAAYNSVVPSTAWYDDGWQFTVTGFIPGSPTGLREVSLLAYADDSLTSMKIDYQAGLLVRPTLAETQTAGVSFENLCVADLRQNAAREGVHPVISGNAASGTVAIADGKGGAPWQTPAAATVAVQKNDVAVASEPTLDFEDTTSVVWTLTDDGANTRVKISATASAASYLIVEDGATNPPVTLTIEDGSDWLYSDS